jgi:hypothetical protein
MLLEIPLAAGKNNGLGGIFLLGTPNSKASKIFHTG